MIDDEQKTKTELPKQSSVFHGRAAQFGQAKDAQRESEEKWRFLLKSSPDTILNLERDGTILFVNHTVPGYTVEDTIGKTVYDFIPPEEHEKTRKAIEKVFQTGEEVDLETTLIGPVGNLFRYSTHTGPLKNGDKIVGVAQIFTDITDRKLIKQSLQESEEKYRTLVESAGESIATINENGVFLFINKTGAKRLGGKPEDYVGKTIWDLFPKEIADRQAAMVREVINTEQGMNRVVLSELQGQPRWYNNSIEPLRDSSGKVIAALTIARDIQALKHSEEEMEMYRERMARAEQLASLGTLSATVAHELTQPLTVIRLSIENALAKLEATSSPENVTRKLKDSLNEVSNVASIVERFRNFARRSTEEIVVEVDLEAIGTKIVKLLNESAQRAKVALCLNGLDKLPLVYSNEKDMEQLFFALVDNAIQAADGKKSRQLIISGAVKNGHIELWFSDNCGGIAPENIDKIFEPFFTTKPKGQGTGLGLCIVQSIVSRAGGKIRVESKFGEGSTFFITLPTNKDMRS